MSYTLLHIHNTHHTAFRPIILANQKRLASAEDYLFSGNNDDALVSYIGSGGGGGSVWEVRVNVWLFVCM